MTKSPKLDQDDPEQSMRFVEAAREIGADESGLQFEQVMEGIKLPRESHPERIDEGGRKKLKTTTPPK